MDNHEIKKTVTVFIEAYANDDDGDGPAYARIDVDQVFIDHLQGLREIILNNNLSEVRKNAIPDEWDNEDDLRLHSGELVVTESSFWFVADVQHADYYAETRLQNIENFIKAVQAHAGDDPLFMGDNVEDLKKMIQTKTEEEPDSDAELEGEENDRFTLNAKGDEVTDTRTGLIWKRCFEGQAWDGQTPQGEPTKFTWAKAMAYAAAQPDGWRLPTVEECRELFVESKPGKGLFPGGGWAWSASPFAAGTDFAWFVFFGSGYDSWYYKNGNGSVRLVRGQ